MTRVVQTAPCPYCSAQLPFGTYYCRHCNRNLPDRVESSLDSGVVTVAPGAPRKTRSPLKLAHGLRLYAAGVPALVGIPLGYANAEWAPLGYWLSAIGLFFLFTGGLRILWLAAALLSPLLLLTPQFVTLTVREAERVRREFQQRAAADRARSAADEAAARRADEERARQLADQAVRRFSTDRIAIQSQLTEAEAQVRRQQWNAARMTATDLERRMRPLENTPLAATPAVRSIIDRLASVSRRLAAHDAEERKAEQAYADATASRDLDVVRSSWEMSGFGTVAIWYVTIKNTSRVAAYRDIEYGTEYSAPSGTKVQQKTGRILDVIEPGQTRRFEVNDGFVHQQASRAWFTITDAGKQPPRSSR